MSDDTTKATITSANLPKPPVGAAGQPPPATQTTAPVEASIEEPIIARPLIDSDFTNIKPKNPLHSFYFGNRVANKANDGGHGLRIEDLLARGFEFAVPDDVLVPDGKGGYKPMDKTSALIKNGRVVRGDLILLKIAKAKYQGQLKYNAESAAKRVSRASNHARANQQLGEALKGEGVSMRPQDRGKISFYNPSDSERGGL